MKDTENTAPVEAVELPAEQDEFAFGYADPNAKLPRLQALRGATAKDCGYFINVDQMAKAGWRDFDADRLVTYTFETSGKEEQGMLFKKLRMLVCPKSNVFAYHKEESEKARSLVILDNPDREDKNTVFSQFFYVFLLDEKNQLLHDAPLEYRPKGANRGSFYSEWQEFSSELEACHAITNRIPARQKDNRFRSLGVFCFDTARELVGGKQKGWACRVVGHEKPTLQNWKDYFLGFTDFKEFVWEAVDPLTVFQIAPLKEVPLLLEPVSQDQKQLTGAATDS